jgi:hypothetical protein
MPQLEELTIYRSSKIHSLKPLSGLMNLQMLDCRGIDLYTSFLPLASCAGLQELKCSRWARLHDLDPTKLEEKRPELRVRHF